jgi:hypothetical protein
MPLRAVVAAALVALALPAPGQAPQGRCTGTVAGAASGSFACEIQARSTAGGVLVTVTPTGAVADLRSLGPFTVEVAGRMGARTFAGDALAAATIEAEGQDGVRYAAPREAVTLTVEQVEREQRGSWYVAGSLSARLAAASGAGAITVAVSF